MVATKYLQEKRKGCIAFLSEPSLKFLLSWEVAALSTRTRSTWFNSQKDSREHGPARNPTYTRGDPRLPALRAHSRQPVSRRSTACSEKKQRGLSIPHLEVRVGLLCEKAAHVVQRLLMDRGGEGMTFDFRLLGAPGVDQSILQLVPVSHDREFWTYTKTFLFWSQGVLFFFFF